MTSQSLSQPHQEVRERPRRSVGLIYVRLFGPLPSAAPSLFQLAPGCPPPPEANLAPGAVGRGRSQQDSQDSAESLSLSLVGGVIKKKKKGRAENRQRGRRGVRGLAVDGRTVRLGFACRADYPHEAVSELLQDEALRLRLRLVSLFGPLGLFQQALARRLQHLLGHERVRQPEGGNDVTDRN